MLPNFERQAFVSYRSVTKEDAKRREEAFSFRKRHALVSAVPVEER